MSTKIKTIAISAVIVLLLAAVAAVLFFGKDNSGDYEKKLEAAALYLESCDYDNAIAIYNGIIAEDRTCAEAYAGLSEAYYAIDRADKAMEVLEKGVDNTDGDNIVMDKWNELFPDVQYAEGEEDYSVPVGALDGTELSIDGITTVASDTSDETEATETSEEITETTEATTEVTSETTVPTTTTAATTTVTTAAPVTTAAAPVWTNPPVTTTVPRTTVTTTAPTTTTVVTTTTVLRDVTIKDFTTMSLDEAYSWCSKNNIILTVIGDEADGSDILSQSPAPGSVVKENSEIIVVLDS